MHSAGKPFLRGHFHKHKPSPNTSFEKTRPNTMKKFLFSFILSFAAYILYAQTPPVVYVAGDGTGDFNCDGTSDQVQINQALDYVASHPAFTTVYLKGPNTYYIDETIFISSNTIFTGDSTAKIELIANAGWWTRNKPLIAQKERLTRWNAWGDYGDSISNVEIYGFEISGGLIQQEPKGAEYIPLIHFCYPHNVSIHHMHLHDSRWDVIRLTSSGGPNGDTQQDCNQTRIYDNLIEYSGHEGICFVGLKNFEVFNNTVYSTRTNCGIRLKDTDDFEVYGNIVGNAVAKYSSGFAGIFVENQYTPLTGRAEIHHNVIYGKNGGIHLGSDMETGSAPYAFGTRKNVHIHHNRIYRTKNQTSASGYVMEGAIFIAGYDSTLVEHNIIDGSTTDGIIFDPHLADGTGYRTLVRNNIIINVSDTALNNRAPGVHTFVSDNNLFYNNRVDYAHANSSTDLYTDPLFGTSHSTLHQWHHIVATYDNTTETMSIYIDGTRHISRVLPGFGAMAVNNDPLLVGIQGHDGFRGRMDELAVWNRALSPAEIGSLYNNGSPVDIAGALTNGLQAYIKMDGTWDDASGNHFNAQAATATFTTEALLGSHAGLFDGSSGVQYPSTLSTSQGISISLWVYRTDLTGDYQPLVNKGDVSTPDAFNLYFTRESVEFDLGDGTYIATLQANIIEPWALDYHVQSEFGRWDGGAWVNDTLTSPCVDGGYVLSDYALEPMPNGGRVNIGLYGNTPEASKSGTTAVHKHPELSLRVYPNPTQGLVWVDKNVEHYDYEVVSLLGTIVQNGKIESGSVDLSKLNSGIYFLKIHQPESNIYYTAKIIKY